MKDNLKLRGIFADISKGYSEAFINKSPVLIKHLGIQDQVEIDYYYDKSYNEALERGVPTEKERLEKLEERGFWLPKDEMEIATIRSFIDRLKQTKNKKIIQAEIDALDRSVKDEEVKLYNKIKERESFVGQTAEKFASGRLNDFFIFHSFRMKKDVEKNLYDPDEFDNLEEEELANLISIYNHAMGQINEKNIKLISVQSFFQNYFYLTDSIYEFWGKRIVDLTIFQSELSAYGRYFKSLVQNSEVSIPDEIRNDPERLIQFANMNNEAKKNFAASNSELGSSSLMGASQEDYNRMGIKTNNPESIWARKKLAATGKGSLTSREIAELRMNGSIKKWDT